MENKRTIYHGNHARAPFYRWRDRPVLVLNGVDLIDQRDRPLVGVCDYLQVLPNEALPVDVLFATGEYQGKHCIGIAMAPPPYHDMKVDCRPLRLVELFWEELSPESFDHIDTAFFWYDQWMARPFDGRTDRYTVETQIVDFSSRRNEEKKILLPNLSFLGGSHARVQSTFSSRYEELRKNYFSAVNPAKAEGKEESNAAIVKLFSALTEAARQTTRIKYRPAAVVCYRQELQKEMYCECWTPILVGLD